MSESDRDRIRDELRLLLGVLILCAVLMVAWL